MTSRALAILMLALVTSFVVNAFASVPGVSQEKILATLRSLDGQKVQNDAGEEIDSSFGGSTLGGRSCEASVANFKGQLSASITSIGMGQQFDSFEQSKIVITDFNDNGQKFVAVGLEKSSGRKQALVVETTESTPRKIKSVEFLEEKSSLLGFGAPKMVSIVKCR